MTVGTERKKAFKSETKKKVRLVPVELALHCVVARQSHVKFSGTPEVSEETQFDSKILFTFLWKSNILAIFAQNTKTETPFCYGFAEY